VKSGDVGGSFRDSRANRKTLKPAKCSHANFKQAER